MSQNEKIEGLHESAVEQQHKLATDPAYRRAYTADLLNTLSQEIKYLADWLGGPIRDNDPAWGDNQPTFEITAADALRRARHSAESVFNLLAKLPT